MTFLNKSFAATTAMLIALGGSAQADAHSEFDVNSARLDMMLDTDGNGEVSDDEIIDANVSLFDVNGNGTLDANERGVAEQMIMSGAVIDTGMVEMANASDATIMFDVISARRDMMLDADGDGDISDDEIIRGNEAVFDTDANGALDADERGVAELFVANDGVIDTSVQGNADATGAVIEFDVRSARLDTMLDANGDGDVSDDEIIRGNEVVFDTDGNGTIDADERGVAERIIANS